MSQKLKATCKVVSQERALRPSASNIKPNATNYFVRVKRPISEMAPTLTFLVFYWIAGDVPTCSYFMVDEL